MGRDASKENPLKKVLEPGDVLFKEGDIGDFAVVIESGALEISRNSRGNVVVLGICGRGDLIGEMALIDDSPRSATVTAKERTTVAMIRRGQILRRLDDADPIVSLLLRTMLDRFRSAENVLLENGDPDRRKEVTNETTEKKFQTYEHLLREREVEHAIDTDQIEAFYQPIMDLRDGRLKGFEALVRWRHPDRGIMMPIDFVPLAEKSRLIVRIDRHIAALAGSFIERLNVSRLDDPLSVNINLSSHQFHDDGIIQSLEGAITDTGIDPSWLHVEVTENTLIEDSAKAKEILGRLRDLGMCIALDDFGTGYSSLAYLMNFPINTLKVDRSFVATMTESDQSMKVVRCIAGLAQSMELNTVCEGIETEEQLRLLKELGFAYGQGYLFSKPMPADQAVAFADAHRGQLALEL